MCLNSFRLRLCQVMLILPQVFNVVALYSLTSACTCCTLYLNECMYFLHFISLQVHEIVALYI